MKVFWPKCMHFWYYLHAFAFYQEKVLKAKLACHPARCLLLVEIIERCGLSTGPATVELLSY